MIRLAFSVSFLFLFSNLANAVTCRECMSQCPHDTRSGQQRELLACDQGCPGICSKDELASIKEEMAEKKKYDSCKSCMAECPHNTRNTEPCDEGCPGICDLGTMKKLYLELKTQTPKCVPPQRSAPKNSAQPSGGTF